MGNCDSTAIDSAQENRKCTKTNASSAMKETTRNSKTKETMHAKLKRELRKLDEDMEKATGVQFQNDTEDEVQEDASINVTEDLITSRGVRIVAVLSEQESLHQQQKLEKLERKVQHLEETIAISKLEKQSSLDRLSEKASMKLKDGNPNITDLSDCNRPDKLAEHFSELYDNQWTDSYELLTTKLKMKDKDAICSLLNIVQLIHVTCISKSESLDQQMHTTLALYLGQEYASKEDGHYLAFREKVMFTIRDFRGKNYIMSMNDVKKDIKERLRGNVDENIRKLCKEYISECSRVCWLMCIKNPPMYLTSESGILFNEDIYRSYTANGLYIEYVVWPVLYLHKHGPILKKGVAQGKMKKPKSSKAEVNNRDHTEDDASLVPNGTTVRKRRNSDPLSLTHSKAHDVDTGRIASTPVMLKTPNKTEECPTMTPGFIKADQTLRKGMAQSKRQKPTSVERKENNRGHSEEVVSLAPNCTSVYKILSNNDVKDNDKEVSDVGVRKRRNSDPLSVKHSKTHDVNTGRLAPASPVLKKPNKTESCLTVIPGFIKADQASKVSTVSTEVINM